MCGEKFHLCVKLDHLAGSPPRVRGEACCILLIKEVNRITPACAGRSHCSSCKPARGRDHPRVCGEKTCCAVVELER